MGSQSAPIRIMRFRARSAQPQNGNNRGAASATKGTPPVAALRRVAIPRLIRVSCFNNVNDKYRNTEKCSAANPLRTRHASSRNATSTPNAANSQYANDPAPPPLTLPPSVGNSTDNTASHASSPPAPFLPTPHAPPDQATSHRLSHRSAEPSPARYAMPFIPPRPAFRRTAR